MDTRKENKLQESAENVGLNNADFVQSPPNKLIGLFKRLQNLCEKPKRDETLWNQCCQRAKGQLRKEQKIRLAAIAKASGLSLSRGCSNSHKKTPEPTETEICQRAEQLYQQENPEYVQKLERLREKMIPLAKEIHRMIFTEKANLIGIREAKETLLIKDWWHISQHLSVEEVLSFERAGLFERTIDALEVVKQTPYWQAYTAAFVKELKTQTKIPQTMPGGKKGRGQPRDREAEKSIELLSKLLKDETNFSDMPKSSKRDAWEWIADKIAYPKKPNNTTPHFKIMQGYLRRNSLRLYEKLKKILEKN
jgi:hypothetical protein